VAYFYADHLWVFDRELAYGLLTLLDWPPQRKQGDPDANEQQG